jgi:mannose-1-phosphate guanylyltransferase/mannose-6-phosphate isomerase
VVKFVEKPDLPTAKHYIESHNYLWNSGMFMFLADKFLAEMSALEPFLVKSVSEAVQNATLEGEFVSLAKKSFCNAREVSIDYALMERSQNAAVVPMDCGWSDAGAWDALWRISDKDTNGNVVHGNTFLTDTKNSHIHSDSTAAIAALGLEDTIVVATNDVILVADKSHAQDVKKLIKEAEQRSDGKLTKYHTRVYRPWGHYETIEMGNSHQVKHIEVKPKARLSVQSHNHRAEHWVIVSGRAKVRVGDRELVMTNNEYVHIPVGAIHCIENIGNDVLKFIEVQHGDYLGEDDIVRYDDIYGRVPKAESNENVIPMRAMPERQIA